MGTIDPIDITLRGYSARLRAACPADAAALIELSRSMTGFEWTLIERDEVRTRIDDVARIVERADADPQRLMLVAIVDGRLVGRVSFVAPSKRRLRHRGRFSIAVAPEFRGMGIGGALINALLDWARAHPHIEKIRLGVVGENTRAISLYRRLGFVEEARRRGEFKLASDRYADDVLMCRWVKPKSNESAETNERPVIRSDGIRPRST